MTTHDEHAARFQPINGLSHADDPAPMIGPAIEGLDDDDEDEAEPVPVTPVFPQLEVIHLINPAVLDLERNREGTYLLSLGDRTVVATLTLSTEAIADLVVQGTNVLADASTLLQPGSHLPVQVEPLRPQLFFAFPAGAVGIEPTPDYFAVCFYQEEEREEPGVIANCDPAVLRTLVETMKVLRTA